MLSGSDDERLSVKDYIMLLKMISVTLFMEMKTEKTVNLMKEVKTMMKAQMMIINKKQKGE